MDRRRTGGSGVLRGLRARGGARLAVAALALCSACGQGHDPPLGAASGGTSAAGGAGGTTGGGAGGSGRAGDAEALFAGDFIPELALTLPPERWEQLIVDARLEEYVEAALAVDGEPVGTVGLRFKGYATLNNCFDGDTLVCDKLSIKLKFDEYTPGQRYLGMKRLVLNSMVYDESLVHEYLAYGLFRALGVPAPRAAWATVTVNGEPYGLYSMVEPVDGRFTAARWPEDGDGNLYKEVWPVLGGTSYFDAGLETNEETADHRVVQAFHEALALASSPAERHAVVTEYLDVASLSRFLAVEDAVAARDGLTTFYTDAERTWTTNHNFFLYQETQRDTFTVIPWDQDVTFWLQNASLVPHFTVTPEDCSTLYTEGTAGGIRVAPGCDPILQGLATDLGPYHAAVDELLAGPFSDAAMTARLDAAEALLADAVAADPFRDPQQWRDGLAAVRHNLPLLRARLEAFRAGLTIAPLALTSDGPNTFDEVAAIDALLGASVYTSAASNATLGVGAGDTGAGDQALRFDVVFRDDPEPWTHYAVFYLPFANSPRDVSGYLGLRFRARADQARSLRVELVSDAHTPLGTYIYEGWDAPLTTDWQTIELTFDAAALPSWATAEDLAAQNPLVEVLRTLLDLRFYPECVGRDGDGYLGASAADTAFVELDDLELFTAP